uniref:Uncharacterized protein n=1 Tax=Mus spicilegus TaxID=10103 RepID=A0A8C6HAY8_MUSSI
MGKALPFYLSPYPVDFWTNASFSDEEHEDAALSNSHLGRNAMVPPQGRSGPASWILRSVRDPGFAPCPPWSWIYHQFRIAWLRCVVRMDGRAPQVQTGQSTSPAKAANNATVTSSWQKRLQNYDLTSAFNFRNSKGIKTERTTMAADIRA